MTVVTGLGECGGLPELVNVLPCFNAVFIAESMDMTG